MHTKTNSAVYRSATHFTQYFVQLSLTRATDDAHRFSSASSSSTVVSSSMLSTASSSLCEISSSTSSSSSVSSVNVLRFFRGVRTTSFGRQYGQYQSPWGIFYNRSYIKFSINFIIYFPLLILLLRTQVRYSTSSWDQIYFKIQRITQNVCNICKG